MDVVITGYSGLGLWYLMPFNNISVVSWWSVLLMEETRVPGENHRPAASHLQTITSALAHSTKGVRAKTGWLGIRIICPIGGTLLLVDCCFSELALKKPTPHVGLVGTHLDQNIICSFHNLAENLLIWH
jgi:hypothetical protein